MIPTNKIELKIENKGINMIPTNKIEIKVENNDKCALSIDTDCSLGSLYDFSCVMKSFFMLKMKEQDEAEAAKKQAENVNVVSES